MQEEDHQQSSTLSSMFVFIRRALVTISAALGNVDFLANVT